MQNTSEQQSDRTSRQDSKVERPAAGQKRVCSSGQAFQSIGRRKCIGNHADQQKEVNKIFFFNSVFFIFENTCFFIRCSASNYLGKASSSAKVEVNSTKMLFYLLISQIFIYLSLAFVVDLTSCCVKLFRKKLYSSIINKDFNRQNNTSTLHYGN